MDQQQDEPGQQPQPQVVNPHQRQEEETPINLDFLEGMIQPGNEAVQTWAQELCRTAQAQLIEQFQRVLDLQSLTRDPTSDNTHHNQEIVGTYNLYTNGYIETVPWWGPSQNFGGAMDTNTNRLRWREWWQRRSRFRGQPY